MRAALALAARGLGQTAPNPSVGCVITAMRDGHEIVCGRGATAAGGRPHAETIALDRAGQQARGGRAYVTLEPCCHHGLTNPCCDALIAAGISEIICAIKDPDPRMKGHGLDILRKAGLRVEIGMLADQAAQINQGFFSLILRHRPHVTLKMAASLDGIIAHNRTAATPITGDKAQHYVHLLRARADAVMVGATTAKVDNPDLTCRLQGFPQTSIRIVVTRQCDLKSTSHLVADAATKPLWIVTSAAAKTLLAQDLAKHGAVIIAAKTTAGGIDLGDALTQLGKQGLTRILVEGGARLAGSLLAAGLVDTLVWVSAPRLFGDHGVGAINLPPQKNHPITVSQDLAIPRIVGHDCIHTLALTPLLGLDNHHDRSCLQAL